MSHLTFAKGSEAYRTIGAIRFDLSSGEGHQVLGLGEGSTEFDDKSKRIAEKFDRH